MLTLDRIQEYRAETYCLRGRFTRREQAVAALAVLRGLPGPKLQELEEALSAAKISLRTAESDEVQKRSLAVDIIVDIMMSPSES